MDHEGRSLKSLMKQANKADAPYVLIIGEDELANNAGVLKDMQTQEQMSLELQAEEVEAVMMNLLSKS